MTKLPNDPPNWPKPDPPPPPPKTGMKPIRELSYSEWVQEISNLPITWYPAMIIELVKAAYKKNVFLPGGASSIVQRMEVDLGKVK